MSIEKIVNAMHKYQKINNVKGCCMTNALILYDIVRLSTAKNVKVKAVYAISYDTETAICRFFEGHVVLSLGNNQLIEPSWELENLKDVQYFDSINVLIKVFKGLDRKVLPQLIEKHIYFTNIANRINNGEFLISDEEHYHKQLDYLIQQKLTTELRGKPPCKGSATISS